MFNTKVKKLKWFAFLTLFVQNSLAVSLSGSTTDNRLQRREAGEPSVEKDQSQNKKVCKKDILVLWDNSASIGALHYPKVTGFLKELILSDEMNVRENSTHLGFITFSSAEKTGKLSEVGERTDRKELISWLDHFDYRKDLIGYKTVTGNAFKLAYEMFSKPSPENHRPDVPDLILLFTDGEPNPPEQKALADNYSRILGRNNSITIIGLAGGQPDLVSEFKHQIQQWVTDPNEVYESDLENLNKVVKNIIHAACESPAPCPCGNITAPHIYTEEGKEVSVQWEDPTDKCKTEIIHHKTITPQGSKSGQSFSARPDAYRIEYRYLYQDGKDKRVENCHVSINVTGCKCTPSTQTIYANLEGSQTRAYASWSKPVPTLCPLNASKSNPPKTNGWFTVGEHRLTYNYTHESAQNNFTLNCRVNVVVRPACKCPETQTVNASLKTGETRALVSWSEPKPTSCQTTPGTNNLKNTTGRFSVGEHKLTYTYALETTQLECHVKIVVSGEYCGKTAYNPATHVCCCGEARGKTPDHKCCGTKLYNSNEEICCQDYSVVSREGHCPN